MPGEPTNLSTPPSLHSIDDVLAALDDIIERSVGENSTAAIFAHVYRRTTAKVKEGIAVGRFEDNRRMEQFDVVFARKYIDAWWDFKEGRPVAKSWELAFSANGNKLVIMQHVLLGMNAHINLDLGIAAAEFAPEEKVQELEQDFMLINELLAELVDEVQERIGSVSPLMFFLDWVGKSDDEAIVNFSITKARECAWEVAEQLSAAPADRKASIITDVDNRISGFGRIVAHPPGFLISKVLAFIRLFEEKDIGEIIEKLRL